MKNSSYFFMPLEAPKDATGHALDEREADRSPHYQPSQSVLPTAETLGIGR